MVLGVFSFIVKSIENGFYRWGHFLANRPWAGIVIAALVTVGLGPGMILLETESRGDKLWVPGGTRAQDDKAFVEDETDFQSNARFSQFILTRPKLAEEDSFKPDPKWNVLEPKMMDYALQIHREITGFEFEYEPVDAEKNETGLSYSDLCVKIGKESCWFQSLLMFFTEEGTMNFDPKLWDTKEKILDTVNKIDPETNPLGFSVDSLLGGIEYEGNRVVGAAAFPNSYLIQAQITSKNGEDLDPRAKEFERKFLDVVEEQADKIEGADDNVQVERFTPFSFEDEFGKEIDNDLNVLFSGIFLILLYTFLQLSMFKRGCVGLRIVSTMGGLVCIGLAILTSWGLCAYFDLFSSPLVQVLPFLLIGIGVDDLFVLTNAFDNTAFDSDKPDMQTRVARALAEGGTSITITSLTNFGAFIIGSNTTLPALRNFSIFAAFGVLFDYFFTLTLYPAFLVYDTRRQQGRRYECCCCIVKAEDEKCCCMRFDNTAIVRGLMGFINKMLSIPFVQFGTFIAFLGLLGAGIYGVTEMDVDADVDNFIPAGTYLREWFDVRDTVFKTLGDEVNIYIHGIDHSDPQNWEKLDELYTAVKKDEFVVESTSWFDSFRQWASKQKDDLSQENFSKMLVEWGRTPEGFDYMLNDVRLLDDENNLETPGEQKSRYTVTFKFIESSSDKVDSMDSIRESVDTTALGMQQYAFAYSGQFLDYEQYKTIGGEALRNIGLGFAMIAVVIFLLLGNLVASALTVFCVLSAVVEVVGFMHFWGLTIDSVVVIFVVISLGLSVDYSAHVAHGYLFSKGTRSERREAALVDTGTAVFNGAFSTLLAVILLSTAQSYIFVTFFRALLCTVVFGMLQGLIVLPILLTWFNPKSFSGEERHMDRQKSQGMERRRTLQMNELQGTTSKSVIVEKPAQQEPPVA